MMTISTTEIPITTPTPNNKNDKQYNKLHINLENKFKMLSIETYQIKKEELHKNSSN